MSAQPLSRIVSTSAWLTVDQLRAGDFNYNTTTGELRFVVQDSTGAKALVPVQLGGGTPGQVNTNSTFTAGSTITAGQFLAIDTTGANKLVPCSFPGQPAVAVARANAATNALVDACLFGPISVKAGSNFAIGAVLKTNLNAEAVAATALNVSGANVNGSAVLGYALSAGVTGAPVTMLFVGGASMLPVNYQ
jgi:hypothetical protein